MFEITDDFLVSVGYDLAVLTDEQIKQYKSEMTEELGARLVERFVPELDDNQVEEFADIQDNAERAYSWLGEFHPNYRDMPNFNELVESGGEEAAAKFVASTLWMSDAIPAFGELVQEEMQKYQEDLINLREMANGSLGLE